MALYSVIASIDLSVLSLSQLISGSMTVGAAVVATPLIRKWRQLRRDIDQLKGEQTTLKTILDTANEARCWWQDETQAVETTYGIIHLLGLNSDQPIFLQDIINQFASQDAFKLNTLIGNLKKNHAAFSECLYLIDEQTMIRLRGAEFVENGTCFCVLSFTDVTSDQAKREELEKKLDQLTQNFQRLSLLVDMVPVAIWYRGKGNKIEFCNQVYAGILDTVPRKVVQEGRELIEIEKSSSPYQMALKAGVTGQPQARRAHLVIEGHRRMIEITTVPLVDKHESIGYALDLTDIEESAAELAKHIAAHQEVLHHLSTPVAVYAADTRLEFFNHAYLKLFQFDEKWLYQKPTYGEVLQDLRERRKLPEYTDFAVFKNAQLQMFNTLITPLQEMMHQPDGHVLRIMTVPHPLGGLLFMFDDVTDKLALERRYNTLIAVQKETIDNLYEGIIVLGSDNRLRLSNQAISRILDIDPIELAPGRHAGEILYVIRHKFDRFSAWEEFRQRLLVLFNERKTITDRLSLADQSMLQYSYVPLPDGSHLLSFLDVSDRWRFEQALHERNDALEQADRLKSEFISHVSYELRAPLNTIAGFTEILMNQYFGALNERQIDYCNGINDASQRLLSLINDIIDFASVEAGQLTLKIHPIDLKNFLSSLIVLIFNRSNDNGLEIVCHNDTEISIFYGDERRLKQALFNLLVNAIKFTPSGGRIDLIAEKHMGEDGEEICFIVKDTGVGIRTEDQGRIFKLFETTTAGRQYNGTGLGLPLVKSFITLHGGRVQLSSEPGQGTTVVCAIPLMTHASPSEIINSAFPISTEIEVGEIYTS
ncbi:PAS domain-containing sensor histidine kinase [Candidatus Paracaedibacter symbiosus]|uniref:PAS domain-containing sensor histidine kinase n=1 Tax=Candidatus Paracaedibacter symbiosus TaxID=244582 RepID=UPI0006897575|nr:PAS domain-containing sensor histidine kinase [Candidatus Paracaedibacter symbiosus]